MFLLRLVGYHPGVGAFAGNSIENNDTDALTVPCEQREEVETSPTAIVQLRTQLERSEAAQGVMQQSFESMARRLAELDEAKGHTESILGERIRQTEENTDGLTSKLDGLQQKIAEFEQAKELSQRTIVSLMRRVEVLETQNVQLRQEVIQGSISAQSFCESKNIYLADGSHYNGGWQDNHPQGRGEMTFPNGYTYNGCWNEGVQKGYGVLRNTKSEVVYEGEWLDGGRHGKGEKTCNGIKSTWVWNRGRMEQLTSENDGLSYCIDFMPTDVDGDPVVTSMEDRPKFTGKITWTCGDEYNGEILLGEKIPHFSRHGIGSMTYQKDLRRYEGRWDNDKISGNGCMTFNNGQKFEGEWSEFNSTLEHLNNTLCLKREGHPTTLFFFNDFFKSGQRYEGEVRPNFGPWGVGKMYREEELLYEGNWSVVLFVKGIHWVTRLDYKKSQDDDRTILFFHQHNRRYEGVFPESGGANDESCSIKFSEDFVQKNCGPHGKGKEYHGEQLFYDGEFRNGHYHGTGFWHRPGKDIDYYFGGFAKGLLQGEYGRVIFTNGEKLKGSWERGFLNLEKSVSWNFPNDRRLVVNLKIEQIGKSLYLVPHGNGKLYYKDNLVFTGEWKDGVLKESKDFQRENIEGLDLEYFREMNKPPKIHPYRMFDTLPVIS